MRADATLASRLSTAGLDWIVPDWPAPARVLAFSTTKNGPGGAPVDFARAASNPSARALLRRFAPAEPLWLRQVHGAAIASADLDHGGAPEADGAVARVAGRVCAVLSADCLPVLLTDREGNVVAAAHAGWRGLAAGVLDAAVVSMRTEPRRLLAWLGPAIGPRAFEVGADVHAAFCDADPGAGASFAATDAGKWHADLYALARRALARAGVDPTGIYGGGRCTLSDAATFYSYRRGGADRNARMATLIWLAPG
ncbi:MAG TPA: peptidoglycan editing factor PgeF [Casimicrobiaceae bacterium]|nr:peptidoglycan editing factor PgeF [Casimicrobiaceae bacterium]